MGILRNIIAKNYSLADFDRDFNTFYYGGYESKSGIRISEEAAMRFSAVNASIRAISEDIGMLPSELRKWRVVTDHSKGSDPAYDHPLYEVLANEPNSEMNAMIFGETMQAHILLSGNGYAYKSLDRRGRVVNLKLLDWHCITPKRNEGGEIVYEYQDGAQKITFKSWEIFHVPGLGFDGIVGRSPIKMAMEAIGLGLAQEEFAERFFSNGANVGGFITTPGKVKDAAALRTEFETKFAGLGKAHKVLFLEDGMQFQKLVMPLQEAQFIEGRKLQIEEIARIFRIPHHIIQHMEHSTYGNVEHQDLEYTKHTLLPWIRRWEQAIDTRLLTRMERDAGYFSQYKIDELLRGDSKTRAEVNHIKRQDGVITANEWRSADDQNPRPEPEADALIINGNMREISVVNSAGGKSNVLENSKQI